MVSWVANLVALAACVSLGTGAIAQTAESLAQVKKVYLDSFGPGASAETLRRNLARQLHKSGNYQVVDDPGAADAMLKGEGEIWVKSHITSNSRYPAMNRQTVYSGYLSLQVLGRNGATLWSYLVVPSKLIWTNIASDLATSMVKALETASETSASPTSTVPFERLSETQLHGAGATFPFPLYLRWFETFQSLNPAVRVNYDAVGSEAGIEMLKRGEVDFAGSDVFSSDTRDSKLGTGYWRIPVVLGAAVPIYNVPGLLGDLKFTPEILAGIFLGKITRWNDPEVRRWNKGANLPNANIVVVHRSDGSGTTFTFSDYLSKVSREWKEQLGSAYQLNWPFGVGAVGSEGVVSEVAKTPYAIGYVELVYAIRRQLAFGSVRNSSGVFVRANLDNVAEAAKDSVSPGVPQSITNASAKGAYPIATYTWLVLPQQMQDQVKHTALLSLLQWLLTEGQNECSALAYTPLPKQIAEQQLDFVKTLANPSYRRSAP